METLHQVLEILLAYKEAYGWENHKWMISAEHDELFIGGPGPELITADDLDKLEGFRVTWDEEYDSWHMFT